VDIFDSLTILRMLKHWSQILSEVVAAPSVPILSIAMHSRSEQHMTMVEWNDTYHPLPDKTLHQLFEQRAREQPDSVALVYYDQVFTYKDFNERCNELAHELIRRGVTLDTPIGVCVERRPELLMALIAAVKAGGAYVPLDPANPKERLSFMMEDTNVQFMLTQEHLIPLVLDGSSHTPTTILYVDTFFDVEKRQSRKAADRVDPDVGVTLDNLMYVIYTSGSTGKPKGCMIDHRGPLNNVMCISEVLLLNDPEMRNVLQFYTYSFDPSMLEFNCTLSHGRTLWMARKEELLGDTLVEFMRHNETNVGISRRRC